MNESDSQDRLDDLDARGRRAARGLRDHVDRHLEPEVGLARVAAAPRPDRRGRVLVAAAIAVLMLGGLAVVSAGDDGVRIDEDRRHPVPPPGVLTPLGPTDGKDSIGLPVEVTPSTGLTEGQTVDVAGEGFAPGESVGIVQCAKEAGRTKLGGVGAGVDACNIGRYSPVTADADGRAGGRYEVTRFLTTPLTGTIDCGESEGRCIVAMGAISDYDRSGGFGVSFAGGEPSNAPTIPTLTVAPATGLTDGQTVRVQGERFLPGRTVGLQVCSTDPAACWSVGALDEELGVIGVTTDADGRIDAEVTVWQFLPATVAGRYVDCAVSTCTLRASDYDQSTAPPPVPLGFAPGAQPPASPSIAIHPDSDVQAGDEIDIVGGGFAPGTQLTSWVCIATGPAPAEGPGAADSFAGCMGSGDTGLVADDDGVVNGTIQLGDPRELLGCEGCGDLGPTSTTCVGDCTAATTGTSLAPTGTGTGYACDGVTTHCIVRVEIVFDGGAPTAPTFLPPPVPITFRAG